MKSLRNYAISNVASHNFGVSNNYFNLVATSSAVMHQNTNMAKANSSASNIDLSPSTIYANVAKND